MKPKLKHQIKDLYIQSIDLVLELSELGCGDSLCEFNKPTGMQTNGGCRCLSRELTDAERRFTIRLYRSLYHNSK